MFLSLKRPSQKPEEWMSMQLETIKNLLQISRTFNTSFITHSFAIGEEDALHVKCLGIRSCWKSPAAKRSSENTTSLLMKPLKSFMSAFTQPTE